MMTQIYTPPYLSLVDELLPLVERESQRRFLKSVKNQIEHNPRLYPTVSQTVILDRLGKHLRKTALSDTERDALEYVGQ